RARNVARGTPVRQRRTGDREHRTPPEGNALDHANSDLQNLLDSTQIATIFLDTALCITNFTPAMQAILPLRSSDIGRPLTDLAPRFADADLVGDATDVLRTRAWQAERSVRTTDGDTQYLIR